MAGSQVGGFGGPGLTALVGVHRDDTPEQAHRLAAKIWGLRVFDADRFAAVAATIMRHDQDLLEARTRNREALTEGPLTQPSSDLSPGGEPVGVRDIGTPSPLPQGERSTRSVG